MHNHLFSGAVPSEEEIQQAIQAYQDLIVRGRGLSDITTELLALAIFTVIFMAVGLWRFEFD